MTSESREFHNPYPGYKPGSFPEVEKSLRGRIEKKVEELLGVLDARSEGGSDTSVYTGTAGIALLYLLLEDRLVIPAGQWLKKADSLIRPSLRHRKNKRVTFLCGDAGVVCVSAAISSKLGNSETANEYAKEVVDMGGSVLADRSLPDEVLYGRAGYLYSLLFLRNLLGSETVDVTLIHKAPNFKEDERSKCVVRGTVDYLLTLRYPSGNYPSSIGSPRDRLLHWCHGAPGFIHMFIQAYKIFGAEKYLEEAKSCAEEIWRRGLLRKGYSICHGVSGNAYAFLHLWQITQEEKFLYYAYRVRMYYLVAFSGFLGVISFILWRKWSLSSTPEDSMVTYRNTSLGFRFLYHVYANTRLGKWYTRRSLRKTLRKQEVDGIQAHSLTTPYQYGSLEIVAIPNNEDNYTYLVRRGGEREVVLVDVGDPLPSLLFLRQHSLTPKAILNTHKHWDHTMGNSVMKREYPDLEIYGSKIDSPDCATKHVSDGEILELCGLKFRCLHTPGHTLGHTVYLLLSSEDKPDTSREGQGDSLPNSLFTGDLLFLAGAGHIFEGTAAMMLKSFDLISALPKDTLIWPGHEYAKQNVVFATIVEAGNRSLQQKLNWVYKRRLDGLTTIPSTLEEELSYNPFLRTHTPSLLLRLGIWTEEDVKQKNTPTLKQRTQAVAMVRKLKNEYSAKL